MQTLRRLAQNREAARTSRLRKKAYVQQLESSRLKLTQLEQEFQRSRQQGIFISSAGDQSHSLRANGAMAFDVEYAGWLEEQNKQINKLRAAVNSHAEDIELRAMVDNMMTHFDEIFRVKGAAAKADVFHILSGLWKTPRGVSCGSEASALPIFSRRDWQFMVLIFIVQLETELTLEAASCNLALLSLEGFLLQADNLRQQMLRMLTTRQSARAILAIGDYFSRLRALSSLWLARPRE
ncbi:hypothetical protein K1719_007805 [Acacia pycnantha]|nr:hypothetical protein K1719_007805 [Acacia pycnantha]